MPPNAHSFTVPSALTFSSPTVLFITHPAKRKLLFHFPPLSFLLKFHSSEMTLNFVFYMPPISKKEKTMSYSSARQTRTTSPNAISSYPRVRYFLTHTHTREKEIFLFGSRNLFANVKQHLTFFLRGIPWKYCTVFVIIRARFPVCFFWRTCSSSSSSQK